MVSAFRWVCCAIRLPISSSTRFLEPPGTPAKVSWGVSTLSICMVCCFKPCRSLALLATNVFFLVLDQLSIKAIYQQVDGGIHVSVLCLGNQVGAGDVQRTFGFLLQFVHFKGDLRADDLVEMALQAVHLFGYVITQRIGYIELEAGNLHLHNTSPDRLNELGLLYWPQWCHFPFPLSLIQVDSNQPFTLA